jgi:hypothetical protein
MILTQKLSTIAFGLFDGAALWCGAACASVLDVCMDLGVALNKGKTLSPDFEKRALKYSIMSVAYLACIYSVFAYRSLPSVLEYAGHVFFFGGFLAGPNHYFNQYMDLIHGTAVVCTALLCI